MLHRDEVVQELYSVEPLIREKFKVCPVCRTVWSHENSEVGKDLFRKKYLIRCDYCLCRFFIEGDRLVLDEDEIEL